MSHPHSLHESTSPSLSARSPSPNFSGASATEQANWDSSYEREANASGSRGVSPGISEQGAPNHAEESVTCQWEGCELPFSHLQTLIDHIHRREPVPTYLRIPVLQECLLFRTHWREQIDVYMRVGFLSSPQHVAGLSLCSYNSHSGSHWRETIYLPTSW